MSEISDSCVAAKPLGNKWSFILGRGHAQLEVSAVLITLDDYPSELKGKSFRGEEPLSDPAEPNCVK